MLSSEQQLPTACSLDRGKANPGLFAFGPEELRAYLRSKPEAVEAVLRRAPDDTREHTRPAYVFRRPGGGYEVGRFDGVAHEISYQREREDAAADYVLAYWGLERLKRPITEQILETFQFLVRDYGFLVEWRTEHFLASYVTFKRNDVRVIVEHEGLSHMCDVAFELWQHGVRRHHVSLTQIMQRHGHDPYVEQANSDDVDGQLRCVADQMRRYVLSNSSPDPFSAVFEPA